MNIAPAWQPGQDDPAGNDPKAGKDPKGLSRMSQWTEEPLEDEMAEEPDWLKPTPRRTLTSFVPRWARWSAASVLVVLAMAALWYGWRLQHQRSQAQAAETLDRFGGDPAFYHGNVVQLSFSGAAFQDEALQQLEAFPHLRRLVLIDTPVSRDGFRSLNRAPDSLTELAVIGAPRLDAQALAYLREVPQLKVLRLTGVPVDDDALAALKPLKQLERLDLIDTLVSDAGLVHLKELPALMTILLNQTQVTADGVAELQRALPKATIVFDES